MTIRRDLIPPTPAAPAWELIPPAAIDGATLVYDNGGATLTVTGATDPGWTGQIDFSSASSRIRMYELDWDPEPYLTADGGLMLLVEYDQPPSLTIDGNMHLAMRAGGENVIVGASVGVPASAFKTRCGAYDLDISSGAQVGSLRTTSGLYVPGYVVNLTRGDASRSAAAEARPAGPVSATTSPWPVWLDPDSPSVGDIIGCGSASSSTGETERPARSRTPRTPGTGTTLILRAIVGGSSPAFTLRFRLAIVNP